MRRRGNVEPAKKVGIVRFTETHFVLLAFYFLPLLTLPLYPILVALSSSFLTAQADISNTNAHSPSQSHLQPQAT